MKSTIEIKEAFDHLYLNQDSLSSAQIEFVDSLKKYFKKEKNLTEKQQAALFEIKKYMKSEQRYSLNTSYNNGSNYLE
jgi:hypothetical protein